MSNVKISTEARKAAAEIANRWNLNLAVVQPQIETVIQSEIISACYPLVEALNYLNQIQGETLPFVNNELIRADWIRPVVEKALAEHRKEHGL